MIFFGNFSQSCIIYDHRNMIKDASEALLFPFVIQKLKIDHRSLSPVINHWLIFVIPFDEGQKLGKMIILSIRTIRIVQHKGETERKTLRSFCINNSLSDEKLTWVRRTLNANWFVDAERRFQVNSLMERNEKKLDNGPFNNHLMSDFHRLLI